MFSYNKNDQLVSTDLHRVDTLNGVDSHEMISGILFLYYAPIIKPSLILGGRDIDF